LIEFENEGLYEDLSINIVRSNYAMLAERTIPRRASARRSERRS